MLDLPLAALGLTATDVEPYGRDKAKLPLATFLHRPQRGRLVLVSAISPTPAGEGKTTVAIGLADGLRHLGHHAGVAVREPSMGPCFGQKGGGTGGGAARLVPTQAINLHFTGDLHAIGAAHNLLAALIDSAVHHGITPRPDPRRIYWRRVLDVNDRALRSIVVGLGGTANGPPRETGFDVTAASEVMAVLGLARDRADLEARLARIIVGEDDAGRPVTAGDLGAAGAMAALLNDAIQPNLVKTLEGTPAFVHGGPFGNIAHGTNSVLADRAGLALCDWLVTEAGFGFDLGGTKFYDIVCRQAGFAPACVVVVASVRALKMHGGAPLDTLRHPDVEAALRGLPNLDAHLDAARRFGAPVVVALNHFDGDDPDEARAVLDHCAARGIPAAIADPFSGGGPGCAALAETVAAAAYPDPPVPPVLYALDEPVEAKIEAIASTIFGAGEVTYTPAARRDLARIDRLGFARRLPVCIAKTQYSLSDDPKLLGRPRGFELTVRELRLSAGAGFIVPITGEIMTMPGLPKRSRALDIGVTEDGEIVGVG